VAGPPLLARARVRIAANECSNCTVSLGINRLDENANTLGHAIHVEQTSWASFPDLAGLDLTRRSVKNIQHLNDQSSQDSAATLSRSSGIIARDFSSMRHSWLGSISHRDIGSGYLFDRAFRRCLKQLVRYSNAGRSSFKDYQVTDARESKRA
jgi:hypothetical protein